MFWRLLQKKIEKEKGAIYEYECSSDKCGYLITVSSVESPQSLPIKCPGCGDRNIDY